MRRISVLRSLPVCLAPLALATALLAAAPATRPAPPRDDTVDWLMGQSTTAPASQPSDLPASRPASPFTDKNDRGARKAILLLSNGEKIPGPYATTRDKPIRVWDDKEKDYRDIPYNLVKSCEAQILWEREEKEWAFKESGSDIKVYSGKTYPARELQYKVTLLNDQSVTGGIVAPLYLVTSEGDKVFLLNKRQKGDVGQTLKDLVYVKSVHFE